MQTGPHYIILFRKKDENDLRAEETVYSGREDTIEGLEDLRSLGFFPEWVLMLNPPFLTRGSQVACWQADEFEQEWEEDTKSNEGALGRKGTDLEYDPVYD